MGHQIVERNWKTKYCEIDIISSKAGALYFTEVKYRKDLDQGGGIAAITPKKLNQMKFAARLFASNMDEVNMRLAVVTLCGQPPAVQDYLELV